MPPFEPRFVDTNILIRHLTNDSPELSARARAIWKQVEIGQLQLETIESVIVEAVQVLSSKVTYQLPRPEVQHRIAALLTLAGFKIPKKALLLRALEVWVASPFLDFVDALAAAHVERRATPTIVSFDRDFDRVAGITREEPPPL